MLHILVTVYLCGLTAMAVLMTVYKGITNAVKSRGEPVWKLVWTAVIWPAVLLVIVYDWLKAKFEGKK